VSGKVNLTSGACKACEITPMSADYWTVLFLLYKLAHGRGGVNVNCIVSQWHRPTFCGWPHKRVRQKGIGETHINCNMQLSWLPLSDSSCWWQRRIQPPSASPGSLARVNAEKRGLQRWRDGWRGGGGERLTGSGESEYSSFSAASSACALPDIVASLLGREPLPSSEAAQKAVFSLQPLLYLAGGEWNGYNIGCIGQPSRNAGWIALYHLAELAVVLF